MNKLKIFLLIFILLFALETVALAQEMTEAIQDEEVSARDLGFRSQKFCRIAHFIS